VLLVFVSCHAIHDIIELEMLVSILEPTCIQPCTGKPIVRLVSMTRLLTLRT